MLNLVDRGYTLVILFIYVNYQGTRCQVTYECYNASICEHWWPCCGVVLSLSSVWWLTHGVFIVYATMPFPLGDHSLFWQLVGVLLLGPMLPLFAIFFIFQTMFIHLTFHQILMWSMNPKLAFKNSLTKIIWYIVILLSGSINNSPFLEFMRIIVGTKVMLKLDMSMESPSRHNV